MTAVLRAGGLSVRLPVRPLLVSVGLAAALVAALLASLLLGSYALAPSDALRALVGSGDAAFVVQQLRLPRAVTGALVGAALGAAGALLQALTRNPLGSPDMLGLTYGASAGAVFVLAGGGGTVSVTAGALLGGLGTALLVAGLSWRGGLRVQRLVLVGVGVAFTARAVVDLLLSRAGIDDAAQATAWLTGSLSARTWDDATRSALALAVLGPLALLLSRALDRLALGDEAAAALGVHVQRTKIAVVLVSVGLTAVAVTAAGPVVLVAVAAGPVARGLTRSAGTGVVPAALVGALLVSAADVVASDLLPVALPVGVVTAVAASPVLLWVLVRQVRAGAL